MNIERLREFCLSLPDATEDVKWGNDLCFLISEKIFCVTPLESESFSVSLKVLPEEFDELCTKELIIPAPYLARYKWVLIKEASAFSGKEWEHFIKQSYDLVKAKLPKKKK